MTYGGDWLHGSRSSGIPCRGLWSWLLTAASALGQGPGETAAAAAPRADAVIELEIVCAKPGRAVPRALVGDGASATGLADRQVFWLLGKERHDTIGSLRKELDRRFAAKDKWPTDPVTKKPVPHRIEMRVGGNVLLDDVMRTMDVVTLSDHVDFGLPGQWTIEPQILPVEVDDPITDGGRLVVPSSEFFEPGDFLGMRDGPKFDIAQDGKVRFRGRVVSDPATKDKSSDPLRQILQELGENAKRSGNLRTLPTKGKEHTVARQWIVVRADKWTSWARVDEFLRECGGVETPLTMFCFAVSTKDQEGQVLKPPK